MSIQKTLLQTGLPVAYGFFREKQDPPYLCYMGNGQEQLLADNRRYHHKSLFRIEYYFRRKDETAEENIENALDTNGYRFEKSEDIYISGEKMFVIYYYVR